MEQLPKENLYRNFMRIVYDANMVRDTILVGRVGDCFVRHVGIENGPVCSSKAGPLVFCSDRYESRSSSIRMHAEMKSHIGLVNLPTPSSPPEEQLKNE